MYYVMIIKEYSIISVDKEKHEKWNHILSNLSPIATVKVGQNIRIKACEGGSGSGYRTLPGFGRVMMHGLIFPSDAYGEIRDSAFVSILRNEISLWGKEPMSDGNWDNMGNGFDTFFTAAARVGVDADTIIWKLKERIRKTLHPNLWISQAGGGIETLSAVPSCVNEMLMQSYEGVIRLFPTWPTKEDAKFYQLRAYGAFLINSELKNGKVQFVKILSEKGRKCYLINPWKTSNVVVKRNNNQTEILSGKVLTINTDENEVLELTPLQ
jgi:hypothetical protein